MVGNKKIISLAIFTNEPVPIGLAATNRFFSYAKGLVESGNHVIIYSSKPGLNSAKNETSGKFEGVEYNVLSNVKSWNVNKFLKLFLFFKAHLLFIGCLIKEKKKDHKVVVFLVTNKAFSIIFVRIITWFLRLQLIQEKSEFPFQYMSSNWIKRVVFANIYSFIIYKLFDGMVVMTEPLKAFFEKKTRKSVPVLLFPLTIEAKRFIGSEPSDKFKYRFIGYCGYMGGNKDGLSDLIESFYLVNKKVKGVKLVLVGDASETETAGLKNLVKEKGLSDSVIFTGRMNRDEIPSFLKSAEILALARPDNIQALGGFPTKLGEYLASGRPVVVTKVGDIPKYIINNEHALLCEPGNTDDIASKIESILLSPDSYKVMAKNGQQFAFNNFDYYIKSHDLESFIYNNFYAK